MIDYFSPLSTGPSAGEIRLISEVDAILLGVEDTYPLSGGTQCYLGGRRDLGLPPASRETTLAKRC
jgi:hypothetical protein